jgi:hypothetical protein
MLKVCLRLYLLITKILFTSCRTLMFPPIWRHLRSSLVQRHFLPLGHLCSRLIEVTYVLPVQRHFLPLGHLCSLLGLKTLVFFPGSEALTSSRTLMFPPGWSHKYVLRVQRLFCSSRTLMFPPELRRGPSGTDPMPWRPRWSLFLFLLESHNSGFLFTSSLDVYLFISGYHYHPN